jgi:SAM-dependent methyltransferase
MKETSQFDAYAAFYDLLYKDKPYEKETEYIDKLIEKFLTKQKSKTAVLDLACGTGNHLQYLYGKGYSSVAGSDVSIAMIEFAKKNAANRKQSINFYNYSFQDSNKIEQKFDVVVSMFSAVNYIVSFEDQSKTLKNIHGLLNDEGLFIFDYWNGNAVVKGYSPLKVLRKKNSDEEIVRISETTIDEIKQEAFVKFTCLYLKDNKKITEFEEVHHLHYYYFAEITNLLKLHRFEVLHISPFMLMNDKVSVNDWNISIVAKRLG